MSRTLRALAAFAALAGLVMGLMVCGTVAPAPVGKPAAAAPAGPGCGESHGGEGASAPAVPPRPHGFGELLPSLAAERTPCGAWGTDQEVADAVPGPEPPDVLPPSPVELSVLRV
ncbi:hypothetical protein ACIGO8_13345 [Streptomyces sp. NPDC053493]|uniref:hypothetical protein n=1 Tax=Streptomyces sp. NPDC053493 TaxID=3365705 RepID=UPI0037D30072